MNYTDNCQRPNLFLLIQIAILYLYTLYTYLSSYFLQHLVDTSILASSLGFTESFVCSLPYSIFLICLGPPSSLLFVPLIHISHVHPSLTTRWLNTDIQVNNMGVRYLIYNGYLNIMQCYCTILLLFFFYTFGQACWP